MYIEEIGESSNVENTVSVIALKPEETFEKSDCIDISGIKSNIQPALGMGFESIDDAWEFYKTLGKVKGFPVVKSTSVKNGAGCTRSYKFTCTQAGKCNSISEKQLRPQATIKCGCQAKLVLRLDCLVGYVISQLNLEHNHELKPEFARHFRCNRFIDSLVKNQIDLLDQYGIRLCKSYDVCVNESGGQENMTCSQKYCRNLIDKLRTARLGEGDAVAILKYFTKMGSQGFRFYSSVDTDDTRHLRSLFLENGRSREEYKEFCEVISFDTTYLVNRYDMPFASFVGLNHHGESILLGCGLVVHEDTNSFIWLFSKWLDCMSGCAPPALITDQAKAMQNAIEIVFPNSRHRWCIWHDGMQSTQRSESMNSFLDGYLGPKTTLKQFVEQFERVMRDKAEKETVADTETWSKLILTATFFEMETQMLGLYTLSKFKYFQDELTSKMYCELIKQAEDPLGKFKYVTRASVWIEGIDGQKIQKQMNFDVIFYSNICEVSCSCRVLEFEGMLCRSLNVLIRHGIKLIPDNEVADMAVKSELGFNDLRQLLVIQLDLLKKNTICEIKTKSPATNEKCKGVQESDSPGADIVDTITVDVDDLIVTDVLNPEDKTKRPGRPRTIIRIKIHENVTRRILWTAIVGMHALMVVVMVGKGGRSAVGIMVVGVGENGGVTTLMVAVVVEESSGSGMKKVS
ncbi:protein FAR1-RELATED SEQUENCE 4-like [Papaver somniferum]|uniref:protein FAR1-RELATED SEQUENCE 4-like n=1 Tax=Papaver somniferum TaxID=3469 RepID=UPI000E70568B|nr:protein FAR1-RELATED SEQUENCE 4-like [Papaver somniferum]